jgi:hypothetical protein
MSNDSGSFLGVPKPISFMAPSFVLTRQDRGAHLESSLPCLHPTGAPSFFPLIFTLKLLMPSLGSLRREEMGFGACL